MYEVEDLPPVPWRRRLLWVLVTLLTVWGLMSAVMGRPYRPDWKPPQRADQAPCQPGQTTGCVGGTAAVIVVPAASGPAR
jgi:hypothetical protein